MIYSVECSFADPAGEAEWNEFYSLEKLPALISVSGFHTSQRFRASTAGCPHYLALHSIDGLDVLQSEEYRRKGGGNFARWQHHITDWHRNLYAGLERAPGVAAGQCLIVSAIGPDPLLGMGLSPGHMQAIALDRSPAQRWLARLDTPVASVSPAIPEGVHVYSPMTAQLTSDAPARVQGSR